MVIYHSGLEKYPRGRRGSPAKGVGGVEPRSGSNPDFSAKKQNPRHRRGFCFLKTCNRDLNPRALGKAPGAPCNPRRPAPQGRSNPDFSAKKQRLRHTAGAHVGLIAFCRDGTTFGSCRFPFHPFIQRNKAHRIEADLDRMHVSANRGKSMAVKGHTFQGGSLLKEKGEINRSLLFFPEQ